MAKRYTDAFRREAVQIATTSGLTRPQPSSDLGVGLSSRDAVLQASTAQTIINIHRIHLPSSDNTKDTNLRYFTPLQLRYAAASVVHYCSAF